MMLTQYADARQRKQVNLILCYIQQEGQEDDEAFEGEDSELPECR